MEEFEKWAHVLIWAGEPRTQIVSWLGSFAKVIHDHVATFDGGPYFWLTDGLHLAPGTG